MCERLVERVNDGGRVVAGWCWFTACSVNICTMFDTYLIFVGLLHADCLVVVYRLSVTLVT